MTFRPFPHPVAPILLESGIAEEITLSLWYNCPVVPQKSSLFSYKNINTLLEL
jgi:hypothetical protein